MRHSAFGGGATYKQHYECVLAPVEEEILCHSEFSSESSNKCEEITPPLKKLATGNFFSAEPTRKGKKCAFTLTEVMIVLVVLGVIAAITVPSLLNNSTEKQNITKVRKALASYEEIVEQMRVTEGLKTVGEKGSTDKTTLVGYASSNNCEKGRSYFKINKESDDSCIFQTNDKVWWNISDMSKPIISFYNEKDTSATDCRSTVSTSSSNACYNKSFYMTTEQGTTKQGNAFIVNNQYSDAMYALYYAKIIDKMPSEFDVCKAQNKETCTVNGITYTKKILDENTTVTAGNVAVGCYSIALKKMTYPCVSKITNNELWYSDVFNRGSLSNLTGNTNYDKMKNYCTSKGARLATMAELKAGGYDKLGINISATEERDSIRSYYMNTSGGFSNGDKNFEIQKSFVCVKE